MEGLQHQSSTLRKLNQPSDDPIGASKVLEIRTDKMNNDQYQMNARMAEAFLNNTDHALGDLAEIILRSKEIAINQASAASSSEDTRLGVSEEVTQLFKQSISIANRRVGERYLFGGYKTQKPPVDPEGKYLGDDGQIMIEIGNDVFISMNVPGIDAFNTSPKKATQAQGSYQEASANEGKEDGHENVNLFDELQNFRIALLTGDLEGIRDTLERFDQLHSKLVSTRAKLGSRLQGLQSTTQSMERHNVTNAVLSSALEDADMAQVVSDLGREETIFRSSLESSKRLIQPTLLDFLK
jgi:flagellar hook-associated protein 3 FlgL